MEQFDLDAALFKLGGDENLFTHRMAFEGIGIFGGVGSGKTSGSGKLICERLIRSGYGGLVCTVKEDEAQLWRDACEKAGRLDDLISIQPGGHKFNFLSYISADTERQTGFTENVVDVLKTVINASDTKDHGKDQDSFWEKALDMLIFNTIDLCKVAYGEVHLQTLFDIVQTVPKSKEELKTKTQQDENKAFHRAMRTAISKVNAKVADWEKGLSISILARVVKEPEYREQLLNDAVPELRLLTQVDQFFTDTLIPLNSRTRSIVDFTFSGFLFQMLRDPIYSIFCQGKSTVLPEDSLNGKIILINLPVKIYNTVGRNCQILFKYIWQRAMEKRRISENGRPLFLWADEAQNVIHEHDTAYQATARSSRIATVYISQNLPNYYASMGGGGDRSKYLVQSFLGTLSTKIFHANADVETNKYASELIGQAFYVDEGQSITTSTEHSMTDSRRMVLQPAVRPEEIVGLKTGSPKNNFYVEAYLHRQGDKLLKNRNYIKMRFRQQ